MPNISKYAGLASQKLRCSAESLSFQPRRSGPPSLCAKDDLGTTRHRTTGPQVTDRDQDRDGKNRGKRMKQVEYGMNMVELENSVTMALKHREESGYTWLHY